MGTLKLVFYSFLLFLFPLFECVAQSRKSAFTKSENRVVLTIPPGINNPRNSEGDFITLKNGKIVFIYSHFIGKSGADDAPAYLASRYSTNGGKTWNKEDKIIIRNNGTMNVMSVSLLRLDNGNIALFYVRKNSPFNCIPYMRISTDEARSWGPPIPCITNKAGYFVLNNNRVIQLKDGRLLMPVSLHAVPGGKWSDRGKIFCYYSDDNGRNWSSSEEVPNPNGVITQEPGVVQLKNGNIFMFIRTNMGYQYSSYSKDDGKTWSPIKPTSIVSPLSPASIKTIPSSNDLLLVWNDTNKRNSNPYQNRTPLNIAISKDEGKTWKHIKTLEDDPKGNYCYTAIHFVGKYVLLAYGNGNTGGTIMRRISLKWILQ